MWLDINLIQVNIIIWVSDKPINSLSKSKCSLIRKYMSWCLFCWYAVSHCPLYPLTSPHLCNTGLCILTLQVCLVFNMSFIGVKYCELLIHSEPAVHHRSSEVIFYSYLHVALELNKRCWSSASIRQHYFLIFTVVFDADWIKGQTV